MLFLVLKIVVMVLGGAGVMFLEAASSKIFRPTLVARRYPLRIGHGDCVVATSSHTGQLWLPPTFTAERIVFSTRKDIEVRCYEKIPHYKDVAFTVAYFSQELVRKDGGGQTCDRFLETTGWQKDGIRYTKHASVDCRFSLITGGAMLSVQLYSLKGAVTTSLVPKLFRCTTLSGYLYVRSVCPSGVIDIVSTQQNYFPASVLEGHHSNDPRRTVVAIHQAEHLST